MAYAVLPDMEQELVDLYTSHTALTPLIAGRVSTELHSTLACLQITSLGGSQRWPHEASMEFQLSAWGGTKAEASLIARTAVAATYDLVGTAVDGGRVVGVDVRLAPLWLPDEDTNRPRYRTDIAVVAMP